MKILVTGSSGFIGKNLLARLAHMQGYEILPFDTNTDKKDLGKYCKECDVVVHLAGVNRTTNPEDFRKGNIGFTGELLAELVKAKNKAPVIYSGSTHAELDTDYGKSKRAAEDAIRGHARKTGAEARLFRLANVFGKWSNPNYNSVVATFCHNVANGLPITVSDENVELTLVYIDDVIEAFIDAINGKVKLKDGFCVVPISYKVKLGALAALVKEFAASRESLFLSAQVEGSFEKKLYSTFTSYLPKTFLKNPLKMNFNERGSFTEFLKTKDFGQVSINISKPGIVKGNHWHHSKNEKFLVVNGKGIIRVWERGDRKNAAEFYVSGEKLEVIDMPCGCVHNIENTGDADMVTIMWANEVFDAENPDTYFEETGGK